MNRFSLFIFFLSLLVAAPWVGEEPDPPETGYTENVSVTAARVPIPVAESGNSITILTREQIEERGHLFLGDLLRGIPGLSVSRFGPAGTQTQVRVRGAEANHVLVRIDGVDVSDAFGADELPLEIMTAADIERIEFVRGPQSGLWGSEAVAGVINVLTRSNRDTGGSARLEGGSFGSVRAGGRYTYGADRLRFEAGISHLETDGSNISVQGSEDDGTRNTTASASLRLRPSSAFDLDLSVRHTDSRSDFDDVDFVTTGLPVDADNTTDTDLTVVRLGGSWNPESSRWSHQATASAVESDSDTTLSGAPDSSVAIDKLTLSFQSSVELESGEGLRHGLTFAADHETRDFSQRGIASIFGDPNQDQEIDNTGVAVEYRFRVREQWAASAAVRHDDNSDFDDATTFRLTGSRAFQGGKTRVRVAVGTGQKSPTFVDTFGFFPGSFIGNPDLKPEKSQSFEVGVDRQFGERTTLAATYFNATLEDEINGFFFDATAGAFTAVNEDGESDREGLELSVSTVFGKRTDLQAGYTYTDATQPDGLGGSEREIRRPEHMASLAVGWRSDAGKLRVRGNLAYNGKTDDLFFPPFPAPSQVVELDSYVLADVNAAVRLGRRMDLHARVENLFDENYEDVFGFRAAGIGAYVGIAFSR